MSVKIVKYIQCKIYKVKGTYLQENMKIYIQLICNDSDWRITGDMTATINMITLKKLLCCTYMICNIPTKKTCKWKVNLKSWTYFMALINQVKRLTCAKPTLAKLFHGILSVYPSLTKLNYYSSKIIIQY